MGTGSHLYWVASGAGSPQHMYYSVCIPGTFQGSVWSRRLRSPHGLQGGFLLCSREENQALNSDETLSCQSANPNL